MKRAVLLAQLLVAAALLALPVAEAQAQPILTVSLRDVPNKVLSANETVLVPLKVQLTVSNFVCTSAARVKVAFASAADSDGNDSANRSITATPSPAELLFTIPQGAYGNNAGLPAAQPYSQTQSATIGVTARNLTLATNVTVSAAADLVPEAMPECRSAAGAPTVTNAKSTFVVAFGATAPVMPAPGPELPVPWSLVVFAVAAAALIMRRRAA